MVPTQGRRLTTPLERGLVFYPPSEEANAFGWRNVPGGGQHGGGSGVWRTGSEPQPILQFMALVRKLLPV